MSKGRLITKWSINVEQGEKFKGVGRENVESFRNFSKTKVMYIHISTKERNFGEQKQEMPFNDFAEEKVP